MKKGFSLVEVMLLFLAMAIVLAASMPMISRKTREIPTKIPHGMYRCIPANDGGYTEEVYSARRRISSKPVSECSFNVPNAKFYKVDLYGAGAGGVKQFGMQFSDDIGNTSTTMYYDITKDDGKKEYKGTLSGNAINVENTKFYKLLTDAESKNGVNDELNRIIKKVLGGAIFVRYLYAPYGAISGQLSVSSIPAKNYLFRNPILTQEQIGTGGWDENAAYNFNVSSGYDYYKSLLEDLQKTLDYKLYNSSDHAVTSNQTKHTFAYYDKYLESGVCSNVNNCKNRYEELKEEFVKEYKIEIGKCTNENAYYSSSGDACTKQYEFLAKKADEAKQKEEEYNEKINEYKEIVNKYNYFKKKYDPDFEGGYNSSGQEIFFESDYDNANLNRRTRVAKAIDGYNILYTYFDDYAKNTVYRNMYRDNTGLKRDYKNPITLLIKFGAMEYDATKGEFAINSRDSLSSDLIKTIINDNKKEDILEGLSELLRAGTNFTEEITTTSTNNSNYRGNYKYQSLVLQISDLIDYNSAEKFQNLKADNLVYYSLSNDNETPSIIKNVGEVDKSSCERGLSIDNIPTDKILYAYRGFGLSKNSNEKLSNDELKTIYSTKRSDENLGLVYNNNGSMALYEQNPYNSSIVNVIDSQYNGKNDLIKYFILPNGEYVTIQKTSSTATLPFGFKMTPFTSLINDFRNGNSHTINISSETNKHENFYLNWNIATDPNITNAAGGIRFLGEYDIAGILKGKDNFGEANKSQEAEMREGYSSVAENGLYNYYITPQAYIDTVTPIIKIDEKQVLRKYRVGRGGSAGKHKRLQLNSMGSSCSFGLSKGGEILDLTKPLITPDDISQMESDLQTSITCYNDDGVKLFSETADGGKYGEGITPTTSHGTSSSTITGINCDNGYACTFTIESKLKYGTTTFWIAALEGIKDNTITSLSKFMRAIRGLEKDLQALRVSFGGNGVKYEDRCTAGQVQRTYSLNYKYTYSSTYNELKLGDSIGDHTYTDDSIPEDEVDINECMDNTGITDRLYHQKNVASGDPRFVFEESEENRGGPGAVVITW